MKMTGAEIVIHLLERQSVRTVAGIPGGANLPLYDALSRSGRIRHVLARHEQGAGFMAQGMARVLGSPQVCFATSGPGATNVLTAIADAKLDSIPLICITGQVPSGLMGTDAFQEVDTYGMSIPITKHNFLVRSPDSLLHVVPEAFRIASSGRPGPVLIDIPKDVQVGVVEFDSFPEPGRADPSPPLKSSVIEQAAEMINSAQRPILYIGGGVASSGSSRIAQAFAEKGGIPTTMTLMGLGAMPVDHPLAIGMLGMHAARYTNFALEECDLLIAAGVRFDDRATGRIESFCPRAKIVHIDIDPSELHKLKKAQAGIIGDAGEALETLLPLVREQRRMGWLERISELRKRYPVGDMNHGNPCGLIRRAADFLDGETIVVTDVGQHQMWTAQAYPFRRPRQLLTSGGLGTMGFGLPTAIGAALASPERKVVCFSGDGSLMMNIQEMATAVEEQVNVKIILLNNNSLGLVRQQQDLFYNGRTYASSFRSRVDFLRIAEGFGMDSFDLTSTKEADAVFARAFGRRGPCLIHVPVDADEKVFPMVPPGASNKEMIGGEIHAAH
ncbi:MAG: acetolactate synthase large subunit [Desulfobacteraceae bacterium]|nr:MAG: acetolactate synthase large subunit [Desulfobacteraceae bacterium]